MNLANSYRRLACPNNEESMTSPWKVKISLAFSSIAGVPPISVFFFILCFLCMKAFCEVMSMKTNAFFLFLIKAA